MKRFLGLLLIGCMAVPFAFASGQTEANKPVVFVWYPNESVTELSVARDEIAKIITSATGRPVEHKFTTDYTIAIEAIASNNAALGFFGAQGYIEANKKNPKVLPLVVNSGKSGTLSDAIYYSWLAVKQGNEDMYKSGSAFAIDNIQGKSFSFVSTSSTSGFKVPTSRIVTYFSKMPAFSKLTVNDLLEGGNGKFFKEVLYGGSHQGSAINLLTGKADVAAFCDTELFNYSTCVSGTPSTVGAVYEIKKDAPDPFTSHAGERFVLIGVTPVLNGPVIVNTNVIDKATADKLTAAFAADSTTANPKIFVPSGSTFKGMFAAPQRFLAVQDAWYDPIRNLPQ